MILSAQSIRLNNLITPFENRTRFDGMTYGLSACGYDIRCREELFLVPGEFMLASSIEHFNMPYSIMGRVCDKSTWARRGLAVQNTVIEPGWRGYLTLELTNHGTNNIHIVAGSPIAQIVFEWLDAATEQPYEGKYQDQRAGVQEAIWDANT
jgi:dCTP deaminase